MAYVNYDFNTKKEFKLAVAEGKDVFVEPNAFGGSGCYKAGKAAIEGPQYPRAHKWYADCDVDENMRVTKVR